MGETGADRTLTGVATSVWLVVYEQLPSNQWPPGIIFIRPGDVRRQFLSVNCLHIVCELSLLLFPNEANSHFFWLNPLCWLMLQGNIITLSGLNWNCFSQSSKSATYSMNAFWVIVWVLNFSINDYDNVPLEILQVLVEEYHWHRVGMCTHDMVGTANNSERS